jgi:hypothetical protein
LKSGSAILKTIFGGWQVSGMSRYQSGFPLRIGGGNALPIFAGNRPTFVPGQAIRTSVKPGDFDPARDVYLNRAAFTNGPQFGFGNVPRTVNARGFPFFEENFSVLKKTKIRETMGLEFRAEFYNLLNRVNFGLPVTNINGADFGRVSSQIGNPRQMQFGLRFSF